MYKLNKDTMYKHIIVLKWNNWCRPLRLCDARNSNATRIALRQNTDSISGQPRKRPLTAIDFVALQLVILC